jgi:type IV pilus assembly protein PilE
MKPLNTRQQSGFTLVELMIVVAIIGILGAIAYPAYTNSVLKGRRAQGRTALTELLQQQERYMTQNNTYVAFAVNATGVPFKTFSGDNQATAAYQLSATACGSGINECVQVTATPVIADPEVTTLSMTSTGAKSCTGTAASTNFKLCWP